MISEKCAKSYCKDNINLIENYTKAISDDIQQYDCHHKLEITLNCGIKELIEKNLYFNRPSSELIFLTHSEHVALHNKQRKGSTRTTEQKQHMSESHIGKTQSEETRRKRSEAMKGKTLPEDHRRKISESHKGKTLPENQRRKISESLERYWKNKKTQK